jgi:CHAD domain-containing protein
MQTWPGPAICYNARFAMADAASLSGALQKRLDAFTQRLHDIHEGDLEALHQTRVASRRLRELLPLLGLKADTARKLNRRLKRVTRELGAVRELDVLLLLIRDSAHDTRYAAVALKRVGTAVSEAKDAARERLAAKVPLTKLRRLADRIDRVTKKRKTEPEHNKPRSGHQPKHGWVWAADARVVRRAGSLAAAMDAAGALYDSARLHDVRIALKKLRYATEVTVEARGRRETADIAALKDAQDLLGRLHDLEMLATSTRQVQSAQSPSNATLSRDLDAVLRALESDCRALHAHYMHDRKKLSAIADRLRSGSLPRLSAGRHSVAQRSSGG